MVRVSQWLSHRGSLSDWVTDRKTEAGNRASLEKQLPGATSHPLVMGRVMLCAVGFQRLVLPVTSSRLGESDISQPFLVDLLATEAFAPIANEDGDPLGLI